MSEQWYSIVEYARAFAISDMTIRRRIRNGKLHAVLREGKYYIPVGASGKDLTPPSAPPPLVRTVQAPPRPAASAKAFASYNLPEDIRAATESKSHDSISSERLLNFCEGVMQRLEQSEHTLRAEYEAKLSTLMAKLEARDLEVAHLAQQVEDLQLLVKIVEKR